MFLTRRFFLQSTGALAAYLGVSPLSALAWSRPALLNKPVAKGKTLVVIFLRGGADGLNLVVPYGDPQYANLRPTLALDAKATLDLDGFFGLNPRLGALKPLFDSGHAAAAHAVGYDKNTRSHFEEQDVWETGIVGNTVGSDGWVNRHLATSQGHGSIRAVSIGDTLPRILRGKVSAYALRGVEDLAMPTVRGVDPAQVAAGLEHAYCTPRPDDRDAARDLLAQSAGETLEGIEQLRTIAAKKYEPKKPYPQSELGRRLMQAARLIKADVGLEVAEIDYGGWDTHQNQGRGPDGTLGNLAQDLGDSVAAFMADMAERMDDVLVMTLTDFGRTAAENGTGGTDHGWANCMFVAGGAVAARAAAGKDAKKVVTNWPGLSKEQLHEGRDLLHTTDFRDCLGEVVRVHLGNEGLQAVLPGHEFKNVGLV